MQRDPLIILAALEAQGRLNDAIGGVDTVCRALERQERETLKEILSKALDQMNTVNNWLLALAGQ